MRVQFSFFVFNALIFLFRDERLISAFYTVCALHEAGHLFALALCGGKVKTVELSGFGIHITAQKGGRVPTQGSLFVLLAGPAANIAVYFFMLITGCRGDFRMLNLAAAVYNMLPYNSLDGGAVIKLFIAGTVYERTADAVVFCIKLAVTAFAGATAVLCGKDFLPVFIASAALLIGDISR